MKGVLNWVKGHLVVVISAVIALAALPALLFVSTGMNTTLVESVQDDVGGKQRALQNISVQYTAEPLDPSERTESITQTPNEATTAAMKAVIEAHDRSATRVLEAATARNRDGKTPMLDGLFPAPAPAETTAKRQAAAGAWLDAHRALLSRVGAGGPVSAEDLLVQLQAKQTQERERRLNTLGATELPEEAAQEVREILEAFRLDRLRERADDVTFFAEMATFAGVETPESAELPTLEQAWDWQHRYWVHEDILEAAAAANTDPASGLVLRPSERPVRRLVSVATTPWPYVLPASATQEDDSPRRSSRSSRGNDDDAGGGARGATTGSLTAEIRPDFEASLTGRAGWPFKANALYDVRYVAVSAVVDAARLDRFLDAIEAENFMTVVDLDLRAENPVSGLVAGYSYGSGGLMRAEMVVETLWLRGWMGELAPDGVREKMGLPARPAPGASSADEGSEP